MLSVSNLNVTGNTMQISGRKAHRLCDAERACNTCIHMLCPGGGLHHGALIEFQRGRAKQQGAAPAGNKKYAHRD